MIDHAIRSPWPAASGARRATAVFLLAGIGSVCCGGQSTTGVDPSAPGLAAAALHMSASVSPSAIMSSSGCASSAHPTTALTLTVTSSASPLAVDQVTIHLLDGTNLGRIITIPNSDLESQFGNTFLLANSSRAFPFSSATVCFPPNTQTVQADVVVEDATGGRHVLTATAPLR